MTTRNLLEDLKADEGLRLEAYPDPLTKGPPWTIGYGHTGPDVHEGLTWTKAQANQALASDVAHVLHGLDGRLGWWRTLSDIRQDVLANMAFNMGVEGLLGFHGSLRALEAGRYEEAAQHMLDSRWAIQVHRRAARLAAQMRTGEHQEAIA